MTQPGGSECDTFQPPRDIGWETSLRDQGDKNSGTAEKSKFKRPAKPPTNIYILGERNSGTNYAASVLRKAFNPPNEVHFSRTHEYFSSDIPVFRHKHMLRHSLLDDAELAEISRRTDILWVLAVRSPCDWAEAMKRVPWHMCHPNNIKSECPGSFIGFEHRETLRKYSLRDFFEMEFGDWPESTNFRNLSFVTEDNFIYSNVFQLRRHKLMLMKQIIDAVPRNVKIIRLHELERSPETFVKNLILEFNVTRKEDSETQDQSDKMHIEKCLASDEWEIAQREIDWRIESHFGYTFLDCHLCYDGWADRSSKLTPPVQNQRKGPAARPMKNQSKQDAVSVTGVQHGKATNKLKQQEQRMMTAARSRGPSN